uniref:lysozyme n=1 Tax=Daphnia galeata TaxID=27404 RepID=A0A8J2RF43_9CRUS|nr:unnamed protein product [Daphnia galeata]
MLFKIAAACLLAVLPIFLPFIQGQVASVVPEDCLGCLCQASTGCNMTIPCTTGQQYLCGPFLISWAYWADAGKFVLANDDPERKGAFEACVQDAVCAGETVRGYMAKFAQDCNGDGVINCDDYAHLHILGGFGCNAPIDQTPFYKGYLACRTTVQSLAG